VAVPDFDRIGQPIEAIVEGLTVRYRTADTEGTGRRA
jgi:hypothetical protein